MAVYSMTGFGRGTAQAEGAVMTVELKSVNHRFLDLSFRMPRTLNEWEDAARKAIQTRVHRGHVDVAVKYENTAGDATEVVVNEALLEAYLQAYASAGKKFHLRGDITLADLARRDDLFTPVAREADSEGLRVLLLQALSQALEALCTAREAEGAHLCADICQKLAAMLQQQESLVERAPQVVREYRTRLQARLAELLDNSPIDEARLGAEVALFADRCAIDEELVRLQSHIHKLEKLLHAGGAVGRQADFIVQEMNREVNTICSKSQDIAITEIGLWLKGEVEKIREQVQNLE